MTRRKDPADVVRQVGGEWVVVNGVKRFVPDEMTNHNPPRPMKPINHGTDGGYHTHRRRGQVPCDACVAAHSARTVAQSHATGKHTYRPPAAHGTPAGYRKHLRDKTVPCRKCMTANAADRRRYRAIARAAARGDDTAAAS